MLGQPGLLKIVSKQKKGGGKKKKKIVSKPQKASPGGTHL